MLIFDAMREYPEEDYLWVSLASAKWTDSSLALVLRLKAMATNAVVSAFEIKTPECLDYKIVDANGGGLALLDSGHCIVRQFTDAQCGLYLSQPGITVAQAMGNLLLAHSDAVDDWIDINKYLRSPLQIARAIEAGRGLVASGPRFLMCSYAKALGGLGGQVSLVDLPNSPAKPLQAIHFGDSYVVGSPFSCVRCDA